MKRKRELTNVSCFTRSKKPKLFPIYTLPKYRSEIDYISATKTHNFMLNDSLVDWIKLHGKHTHFSTNRSYSGIHNKTSKSNVDEGFTSFIMNKGIEFESELVKYINTNKFPITTVSEYINKDSIQKTIDLMKEGVAIIHSAPVRNTKNRTHGIIDLLVRSDLLHLLVNECPLLPEEKIIPSPKLGHDFHYVVIDIKFSTLPLRADGRHLLNSGSYPAYKAQCLIYTDAIGHIQGYTSQYAFILGRRWKYTKKDIKYNSYTCLDKMGVIDYKKVDKSFVERTSDSLKWIRENKKHGHKWSISPPSREELYPNMCYDSGKWQQYKEKIADDIGEITKIWYCGIKHRNTAIKNGIKNWRDPACNSKNIGMGGSRGHIIDSILNINRQNIDKIRPKKIKSNMFLWRNEVPEIFVDFETLSDIFSPLNELPFQKQTNMIFMIGIWYKEYNEKKWVYKRFTCKTSTIDEELRIMKEFNSFVEEKNCPKIWYWCAEKSFWNNAYNRQIILAPNQYDKDMLSDFQIYNWVDMCELFKNEPIVIKDCFKFGLKPISKAMYKHGLITTKLKSDCTSGMTAMVNAYKCYDNCIDPPNCTTMNDIAKYNKFDVSVLEDILTYLRKNH
jgi:hypothetical protein